MQDLIDFVKTEVPYGGQWLCEKSHEHFLRVGKEMYEWGIPIGRIKIILKDLYNAVLEDCGE